MRRLLNLLLVGVAAVVLLAGLTWVFRDQLAPWLGVNVDAGGGGAAELQLPDGYASSVFADGLDGPRFMDISPDGVLFLAERGTDRIVVAGCRR